MLNYYKRTFPLKFNANIFQEHNIAKLPDFDVSSHLDNQKP